MGDLEAIFDAVYESEVARHDRREAAVLGAAAAAADAGLDMR